MLDYADIPDTIHLADYFKHDPNYISGLLNETKDGRLVASKTLDIVFPDDYSEKNFAKIDGNLELLGIFAIIDPVTKKYATFMIPAMVRMAITTLSKFTHNETKYSYMRFEAFETILETMLVISDDKLSYWLYDYFLALARVPWYVNYVQLLKMYDQDKYYVGPRIAPNSQIVELIISSVFRNPKDETKPYRSVIKSLDDINKNHPYHVPLKNISLGVVDSYSKIMGSYYDEGLTSALAEDNKTQTDIEKVLRV